MPISALTQPFARGRAPYVALAAGRAVWLGCVLYTKSDHSASLMLELDSHHSGRHFLQIPGPTNVPDRVLRAIDHPTIDHRGPEFAELTLEVLEGLKPVFGTTQPVIIFPASGTGAWEAALVNTLSPGDRVLMFETGQFAALWRRLADRL